MRRVDNYLDSSFIVILYYDPTIVGFDTQSGYYSATDATVTGTSDSLLHNQEEYYSYTPAVLICLSYIQSGGYRVMHPFRPLDDKEEVIFDIYLSNGILSMVKPHIEVVALLSNTSNSYIAIQLLLLLPLLLLLLPLQIFLLPLLLADLSITTFTTTTIIIITTTTTTTFYYYYYYYHYYYFYYYHYYLPIKVYYYFYYY